jgi:flagellar basal-body rod protein FlgC
MGLFDAIDVSATALSAERLRMDITAENLANAQTTRGVGGGPYRRKVVALQEAGQSFGATLAGAMEGGVGASRLGGGPSGTRAAGVEVSGIVEDQSAPRLVYDPGHPDADPRGYVEMPNVDPIAEMVDLITASRGYEANVTAMQAAKGMFSRTLDLLR